MDSPLDRAASSRDGTSDSAPGTGPGPWSDALGRAGIRAAQILLLAAVVAGAIWLLLRVSVVIIAAVVALILAAAVHPLVNWLVKKGWSRLLATLFSFVAILVVLGGIVTGIVFAVRSQWAELSDSAVAGWDELQGLLDGLPVPIDTQAFDSVVQRATGFVTSNAFLNGALSGISAVTELASGAALMIVILFFFLKDGPKMWNFTLRWFRGATQVKLAEAGDRAVRVLGGYVRGTSIIAAVDAVLIGVGLAILGVPLAVPLAVIVFIGGFIPILGATVAGVLAALVALVTNGFVVALVVIAIVIVVNRLEGDLLQPVLMSRAMSLHALVVLLALAVGTIVGGIFGAILSVPLTAVAWAVIQVWTDGVYQSGFDPVLGEDPLAPKDKELSKASVAERWEVQRERYETRFRRRPRTDETPGEPDGAATDAEGPDQDASGRGPS